MIKHNLEREKTEEYELMQKISEDKGENFLNIDKCICSRRMCVCSLCLFCYRFHLHTYDQTSH